LPEYEDREKNRKIEEKEQAKRVLEMKKGVGEEYPMNLGGSDFIDTEIRDGQEVTVDTELDLWKMKSFIPEEGFEDFSDGDLVE